MASDTRNNAVEGFLGFIEPGTPGKMKEIARKELGETEEVKTICLQQLKALIRENNLVTITRDEFLLRFLRTKKFRVQQSFETLQNYSRLRASFHERLLKLRPEILEKCLRRSMFGFFQFRDTEERITIYFDTGSWNPNICSDAEVTMIILVLLNYIGDTESSQVTGVNGFFECKSIPIMQIPYFLRNVSLMLKFAFNSIPARYRLGHFVNEPSILKYILRLLDPLLPKKIKERFVFHGKTRDALFQSYPPCTLPDCFGGTLGPLSNDHIVDVMLDYFKKMKDEQKYFLPQN